MKTFLSIIKKNLQIIADSKVSLTLLIVGPIFLMLLIGLGLADNGLKNIQTTVYSAEDTEFSKSFSQVLRANSFVVKNTNNLYECKNDVKSSDTSLCIELSKKEFDMPGELGISQHEAEAAGVGYQVNLHVDFSKPRTVWGIIARVNSVVEKFSTGIRDAASDKLKNELVALSKDISSESGRIRNAEKALDMLEDILEETIEVLPRSQEFKDVSLTLKSLKEGTIAEAREVIPYEYQKYLNEIEYGISSSISLIDGSGYESLDSIKSDLNNVKTNVKSLRIQLRSVANKIDRLSDKGEEIGDLNWNYALHPIPMTYSGISGDEIKSSNTELNFLDYLFPSLLGFFVLLISLFLSTNLIIREKLSEANIRNVLSKASKITFFLANFATIFLIVFVQTLALLLIAFPFLNFYILNNPLFFILTLLLTIPPFILLGILIANLFDKQETAIIASISVSLVLIIFSSLVTPLETIPTFFKMIISQSPLVVAESLFRRIFIFESGITQNIDLIISLLLTIAIIGSLAVTTSYFKRRE